MTAPGCQTCGSMPQAALWGEDVTGDPWERVQCCVSSRLAAVTAFTQVAMPPAQDNTVARDSALCRLHCMEGTGVLLWVDPWASGDSNPGRHTCAAVINTSTAVPRVPPPQTSPPHCPPCQHCPVPIHLAPPPPTGPPGPTYEDTWVPSGSWGTPRLLTWDQDVPEAEEGEGPVTQGQW